MKKLLISLLCLIQTSPLFALGDYDYSSLLTMRIGTTESAFVTLAVDSALVYGTSGDAVLYRFSSPVSQTTSAVTFYAYLSAETGSPTSQTAYIYNGATAGQDTDRPETGGSAIATSSVVDVDTLGATWITFSFSSVTLVQGQTYWIILANTTGTPASNFPTWVVRHSSLLPFGPFNGGTTTDGVSTDPSIGNTNIGVGVIKFNDGTIIGNPYAVAANHSLNSNDRGIRVNFPSPVKVTALTAASATNVTASMDIYQGSTLIDSVTIDETGKGEVYTYNWGQEISLSAGTDYDFVYNPGANSTAYSTLSAGASPPSDVTSACSTILTAVDGATPGSYTETSCQTTTMQLHISTIPACAGGGGTCVGVIGT